MPSQTYISIKGHFKAPLSQKIHHEYTQLIEVLSAVPSAYALKKIIKGTGGMVSIPDMVAYQIGWGNLVIAWYRAGIEGKIPQMPGEGFSKWDYSGLAHHFYKKYQYDSAHIQAQKFHDTVTQIIDIVEKEDAAGTLGKIGVWAWCTLPSGKEWPLEKWITVNTVAPYKRATTLIRQFLKKIS